MRDLTDVPDFPGSTGTFLDTRDRAYLTATKAFRRMEFLECRIFDQVWSVNEAHTPRS